MPKSCLLTVCGQARPFIASYRRLASAFAVAALAVGCLLVVWRGGGGAQLLNRIDP